MFEPEELERVVDLQQKSYKLLQWVGASLQTGALSFNTVHSSLELAEVAKEWVERSLDSLPLEVRPSRAETDAFAHLFASYLETSFDLVARPGQHLVSPCGCYCSFCTYLVSANHLKVKNPDKKAQQKARQMKELYLSALVAEAVGSLPYPVVKELLSDTTLAEDIAYATYGRELVRRSQFASQGEGALVLWREISWDKRGKIKKGFTLSAVRMLRAEAAILDRLRRVT